MTYIDHSHVTKTIAFTGAAGLGAVGTVAVFTVTGRVWLKRASQFVSETLVGATAVIEIGTAGDPNGIVGQTTATNLAADEFWVEATGGTVANIATPNHSITGGNQSSQVNKLIAADIILTVTTADVTDGTIVIDIWYDPITPGASLV